LSDSYFSGTTCIFAVSYCWRRPIYTKLGFSSSSQLIIQFSD